jgi:hypothetical protein
MASVAHIDMQLLCKAEALPHITMRTTKKRGLLWLPPRRAAWRMTSHFSGFQVEVRSSSSCMTAASFLMEVNRCQPKALRTLKCSSLSRGENSMAGAPE